MSRWRKVHVSVHVKDDLLQSMARGKNPSVVRVICFFFFFIQDNPQFPSYVPISSLDFNLYTTSCHHISGGIIINIFVQVVVFFQLCHLN